VVFDIEGTVIAIAWMLFGASLLGMLAWRFQVPYAVALVLGALVVEETHLLVLPQLEPRVLLFVFLPPLLFDASFRLDSDVLRGVARPVLLLAVPGTIATAALVALALVVVLQLPWTVAFVFGSIVAATDPIAVVAVFARLGAPKYLSVLADGESLINDGVAITLYTVALGLTLAGVADVPGALLLFGRQVVGGVALGAVLALIFSRLTAVIDDHLVEMTLSTALAYGSFLAASALDMSGALACVAAGLIHGSYGRRVGMSEKARLVLDDLWEYAGFLANALVFLLVGFTASLAGLLNSAAPVLVGILAVVGSRVLIIMGPALLGAGRLLMLTPAESGVLVWGGLRGALTITLALALPPQLAERDLLIAMAFGVVLFTLLVQGITLPLVVRRAGLASKS
jgi:monovalent cation:H+ antiporter, CPA1 family